MTEKIFYHDWESSSQDDVLDAFSAPMEGREGIRILAAAYTYEDYSGSALVVFEQDGKLFVNHGGHCSCNGLEDQWQPEAVNDADKQFKYIGYSPEFESRVRAILEGWPNGKAPLC